MRDIKLPGFDVEIAENGFKLTLYRPAAKKALETTSVLVFNDLDALLDSLETFVYSIRNQEKLDME